MHFLQDALYSLLLLLLYQGHSSRQKQPKGSQVRGLSASWVEKAWLQEYEAAGSIASAVRNKEMKAEDQFTFPLFM